MNSNKKRRPVRGDTVRMVRHIKGFRKDNEAAGLYVGETYTVRSVYTTGTVRVGTRRLLVAKEYELVEPEHDDLDAMSDTLRKAGYTVKAPQPRYYVDGPYVRDRDREQEATTYGNRWIVAAVWTTYQGDRVALTAGIADLVNRLDTDTAEPEHDDEPEPKRWHDYEVGQRVRATETFGQGGLRVEAGTLGTVVDVEEFDYDGSPCIVRWDGHWGAIWVHVDFVEHVDVAPYASGEEPRVGDMIQGVSYKQERTVKAITGGGEHALVFEGSAGTWRACNYNLVSRGGAA